MLTDLLWAYGAKKHYDRVAATGLAGCCALILTLFIAWKWNSIFLPLLNIVGLTAFAENVGAVSENGGITFLNVYHLFLMVGYIFTFIIALPSFILLALCFLTQSKIIRLPLLMVAAILLSPLVFVYLILQKKDKQKKLKNSYFAYLQSNDQVTDFLNSCDINDSVHREGYTFIAQEFLKGCNQQFIDSLTAKQKLNYINKDYEKDARNWLLGYSKLDKTWYLLLENPLPSYVSKSAYYNFEYTDVFNFQKHAKEKNENFYTLAFELEFKSDVHGSSVSVKLNNDTRNKRFKLVNIENLHEIMSISSSPLFDNLKNKILSSNDYKIYMQEAICRAFLIPYFHPMELIKYDKYQRNKLAIEDTSYCAEFFKIPGSNNRADFKNLLFEKSYLVSSDEKNGFEKFITKQNMHLTVI